jgi:hypothetical protein
LCLNTSQSQVDSKPQKESHFNSGAQISIALFLPENGFVTAMITLLEPPVLLELFFQPRED